MASVTVATGLAHSDAVKLGTGDKVHIHYMSISSLNDKIASKVPKSAKITKVTLKVGCYYTLPNAIMDSIYANITLYAKFCNEGSYGSGETLLTVDKIAEDSAGSYTADVTKYFETMHPHSCTYTYTYDSFYVYSSTANVMVRNYYCPTIDLIFEYETVNHTITTKVSPEGAGTVSGGGTYEYGTNIELKATPAQGYKFINKWKDEDEGVTYGGETLNRTVTSDRTFIALFELLTYTITTKVSSSSAGTVSGGGTYDYGKTVTLTATPKTGYKFVKWSDGVTTASRTVTVTANATYTAYFEVDKTYNVYRGETPQDVFQSDSNIHVYKGTKKIYG